VERKRLKAEAAAKRAAEEETRKAGNKEYFAHLKEVTRVTDTLMDTEAAAVARARYAAESRARKAAEAAEIHRENEEMRQRIANVKAVTDNDLSDEKAGEMRERERRTPWRDGKPRFAARDVRQTHAEAMVGGSAWVFSPRTQDVQLHRHPLTATRLRVTTLAAD